MTGENARPSIGLELKNLSKSYGKVEVLKDLSIDVPEGALLSLLGPSGCGKTTTLNLIAGFETPNSGSIVLGGTDITKRPPNKRDTAIVFQNYALFPHLTVGENVAYGLKVRKVSKNEIAARVASMLEMLSIGHLADRYPGQLSGGQQQRVSLARALAVHPSLLLLDEPLSNLDAKLRQDIRVEIRRFQQELNQTAVFVTHDQQEALEISDFIAVLNTGRLEQMGTPHDLWERPTTTYVADFMGFENILAVEDGAVIRPDGRGFQLPGSGWNHGAVGFRSARARLRAGEPDPTVNSTLQLPGRVVFATYTGDQYRYQVDAGFGKEIIVIEREAGVAYAPGTEVTIEVSAEALLSLEVSAA